MPAPESAPDAVLVWRWGDALLALPVVAVDEVARVGADGQAASRGAAMPVAAIPGLESREAPSTAVIARTGARRVALPAADVEGVVAVSAAVRDTPGWLGDEARRRIQGVLELTDGRLAAMLRLDAVDG